MAIYNFRNKITNEIIEVEMPMGEREDYLKSNPDYEQVFTRMSFLGDSIKMGITKPDGAFLDKIRRMKEGIPRNNIHSRYVGYNRSEI